MLGRCRRDRNDLLRSIADTSEESFATFMMRRSFRLDRHELFCAINDAHVSFVRDYFSSSRDRHKLMRAIAETLHDILHR